ncbi:NADP-dependent oxidoreductase [Actinoallomurus soli]|uniref:NADP-dependent oxidoreductase n=1 Tax=Actinoallomurus soli TaxID=2952535 RepID=UPI0020927343|nr:NADP-dependent oxidoreductase [Actinoallomurus soli]MCO5970103.1 NADP-dependent oxidoreductase [Actinoallomurus soli]
MTKAVVLSDYGPPEVLVPGEVEIGPPGPGQIRVNIEFAGVGPTDLAIRSGHLKGAFGNRPGSVLGFEAAGVVDAVGPSVSDVRPGDPVAVFLPELGGYAGQVLARYWVRVPQSVGAQDAAALPASGEAAARVVDETGVAAGETVLIVGAAGSVGLIAGQLAVARGARVLAAVRPGDFDLVTEVGATPVAYGPALAEHVRAVVPSVDAVIDASGAGVLGAAVELAGGTDRVVTLSDPHAADFAVRLSGPDGPHITERLQAVMALLAAGRLTLRSQTVAPLVDAAQVHRDLESRTLRTKVLLSAQA